MLKGGSITGEIAHRTKLKKVYDAEEITAAAAGHFKQTKEELFNKKGKWNRGKRILMCLPAKDTGKNHVEISKLLSEIHHSSIGKKIARAAVEKAEGKNKARDKQD